MAKDNSSLRDLRNRRKAMENKPAETPAPLPPDMTNVEAGQELVAETIEQGNQELRRIGDNTSGIQDVAAATELGAEATENSNAILSSIDDTGKKTFGKLSEFAERLKSAFNTEVENAPIKTSSSSDQVIQIINEAQDEPENPMLGYLKTISDDIKRLNAKSNDDKTPNVPESKPDKDDEMKTLIDRIGDQIVKSVDSGFKRTVNVADSISSMLFKYTITAALNFMKIAALLLSMLIAYDVLSRHISHWTQMFQEQYAEFKETLGSLATPFTNLHGIITDLVNYFKSDEYFKMFTRLAEGAFDQISYVVQMMMVGLAKLGAGILRALNANEAADSLEASAISLATESVGYTPSKEEEATIGRVRKRQAEEAANDDGISYFEKGRRWLNNEVEMTPEEVEAQERRKSIAANTTDAQFGKHDVLSRKIAHVGVEAEKNETSAEMLGKHRELLASRDSDVESAMKNKEITDESYKQLKVEIERQREFLNEHEKTLLQPKAALKAVPEAEISTVDSINKEERRIEASREARKEAVSNNNTQANIVRNNNQTLVQAPRTSSPGPGIGNHS